MIKDAKTKLSVLDDLIAKCEDAEMGPFKKKREAAVVIAKPVEDSPDEEAKESPVEEMGEDKMASGDDKDKLDGMDLEELLKAYQEIKG